METCLDYYSPSMAIQTLSAGRMGARPRQYTQLHLSIDATTDVVLTAHCISMDVNLSSDDFILNYLVKQWLLKKDPFPVRHSQADLITFDDNHDVDIIASTSSSHSINIVFDEPCEFHPNYTNLIVLLFNTNLNSYRIEHECSSNSADAPDTETVIYDQLYEIDIDDDDNCSFSSHNISNILPFKAPTSWNFIIANSTTIPADPIVHINSQTTFQWTNFGQLNIYQLLVIFAAFVAINVLCCIGIVCAHQKQLRKNMQSMHRNIQRLEAMSMIHNHSWTSSKVLSRRSGVIAKEFNIDTCTHSSSKTTAPFISTKDTFSGTHSPPPVDHEPEPSPCYIPIERHSPPPPPNEHDDDVDDDDFYAQRMMFAAADGRADSRRSHVPKLAVVMSNPRQLNGVRAERSSSSFPPVLPYVQRPPPSHQQISNRASAVWTNERDLNTSRSCSYPDEQDIILSRQISNMEHVEVGQSHVRSNDDEDITTTDDDEDAVSTKFNFADDDNRTVTDMTLRAMHSHRDSPARQDHKMDISIAPQGSYGGNPYAYACTYTVSHSAPQRKGGALRLHADDDTHDTRSVSRDWDPDCPVSTRSLSTLAISPANQSRRCSTPFIFKSPVESQVTRNTPKFSSDDECAVLTSRVSSSRHHKRAHTAVVSAPQKHVGINPMSECDSALTISSSVRLPAYHPQRIKIMNSDRHIVMC
eukprot:CAMPEP_0202694638 /NCGR_PEP_ID=MMETSP1385-20130828/8445_1 /ASSEMBLY_ACC=CAM_ASM_000861 /TAXON_ID=933848 /ORGANISM="Elphidium margaritaceum" /LENGTH=697 /DNA_ID=CAMNT_0049350521 /DNA_START=116 /DNA_END=2209 /DNA_ORIENTATION=+